MRVKDNGGALAEEKMPRLFELFFQARPALERSQSRLGIGLSRVRRLVELHGGSIEARRDGVRQGNELTVHLPVLAEPDKLERHQSNGNRRKRRPVAR